MHMKIQIKLIYQNFYCEIFNEGVAVDGCAATELSVKFHQQSEKVISRFSTKSI